MDIREVICFALSPEKQAECSSNALGVQFNWIKRVDGFCFAMGFPTRRHAVGMFPLGYDDNPFGSRYARLVRCEHEEDSTLRITHVREWVTWGPKDDPQKYTKEYWVPFVPNSCGVYDKRKRQVW